MGLKFHHDGKSPFNIDCGGKRVLEVGCGPYAMLLFCRNVKGSLLDPCDYPAWVKLRYETAGFELYKQPAEEPLPTGFDEIWIANCLQHTIDPEKIIANCRKSAKIIRIFEWIECGTSPGHPHELTEVKLNEWLGGEGRVDHINENNAVGRFFAGVFPT
jgi:SAM-dependent methyltransferase